MTLSSLLFALSRKFRHSPNTHNTLTAVTITTILTNLPTSPLISDLRPSHTPIGPDTQIADQTIHDI